MQNTLVSLLAVTCTDIKECVHGASLVAQIIKNLPAIQETRVQSLGRGDHLEKEMASHSSILAWKIPWTEEPGYSPWGQKKLLTTETTNIFTFKKIIYIIFLYI